MRHLIKAFVLGMLLITWATTVQAAARFFTCEVDEAVILGNGRTFVRLTDTSSAQAFANKNFEAPELVAKQMLAVAIAALTANLTVKVRTDPDKLGSPMLLRMHLLFE